MPSQHLKLLLCNLIAGNLIAAIYEKTALGREEFISVCSSSKIMVDGTFLSVYFNATPGRKTGRGNARKLLLKKGIGESIVVFNKPCKTRIPKIN